MSETTLAILAAAIIGERDSAIDVTVHWATRGFEFLGIGVIVIGTICAIGWFLSRLRSSTPSDMIYRELRSDLGRSILLGLELLVAADIISTVGVEPTLQKVLVLGLIVLIRTFLSFSLDVEINGRWPWQERQTSAKELH